MQNTIKKEIVVKGKGLHGGQNATMTIKPASAASGIIFIRTDIKGKDNEIPAMWNNVVDTRLCTVIGNDAGVTVGTIEHVMAALRGCHIHNAVVEIDGPEVPIMDGSSKLFVEAIEGVGIEIQSVPLKAIKVLRPVEVTLDDKIAAFVPDTVSSFTGKILFQHPEIGEQEQAITLVNGNFAHDIADARTFGFLKEVEYLRQNGLAQGGSLDNAIVLDDDKVMNPEGLRFPDEFIRHKLLDAIGDLYLAGMPIIARYEGYKAGHEMNNALLHALFADPTAFEVVEYSA